VKRSPLPPRRAYLPRGKPLRRTRIPIRRRGGDRFPGRRDEAYRAAIRELPCLLAALGKCSGPVEAAHVQSRGAGGGDRGNLVPLCSGHHREKKFAQHHIGWPAFEQLHELDARAIAERLETELTLSPWEFVV
jgi:hypothetical protein